MDTFRYRILQVLIIGSLAQLYYVIIQIYVVVRSMVVGVFVVWFCLFGLSIIFFVDGKK